MKNIFKYLPLIAVIALASCAKEAPSKSSVESGFDNFTGTLPTVAISADAECDAIAGYATVVVTYSGISASLDSLSVGVLSDSDPTFKNAYFTKLETPADGTVSLKAKVTPNKTFYIRGVVACTGGTSYSDVIEVNVPDVPFYAKVAGAYAGSIQSAADGTKYNNTITIVVDQEDPEHLCYIYGIEPYYVAQYGYGTDVTKALNVCVATIDNDANTLTIENGASLHLSSSTARRYLYGFSGPDPTSAEYGHNVVFHLGKDGSSLVLPNAIGTVNYNTESGESSFEDYYYGGVTYAKK